MIEMHDYFIKYILFIFAIIEFTMFYIKHKPLSVGVGVFCLFLAACILIYERGLKKGGFDD